MPKVSAGLFGVLNFISDHKTGMLNAYIMPDADKEPDPNDGVQVGSMLLRVAHDHPKIRDQWMELMKEHCGILITAAAKAANKDIDGLDVHFSPNFTLDEVKGIEKELANAGNDLGKVKQVFRRIGAVEPGKPAPEVDRATVAAELQAAFAKFNASKTH